MRRAPSGVDANDANAHDHRSRQPRGRNAERAGRRDQKLWHASSAGVRLVTFEHQGRRSLGAVEGERVVDLGFPGDMVAFVAGGDQALAWAASKLAEPGDDSYPIAAVKLLAPLVPPVILNSGQNYWDHRDEKPEVDQKEPEFFLKTPFAVIGPDEPVLYDTDRDEEARLRGRAGRHHRQAGSAHPGGEGARPRLRLHDRERRDGARPAGRPAPAGRLGVRARAGEELRHLGAARPVDRDARTRSPTPRTCSCAPTSTTRSGSRTRPRR